MKARDGVPSRGARSVRAEDCPPPVPPRQKTVTNVSTVVGTTLNCPVRDGYSLHPALSRPGHPRYGSWGGWKARGEYAEAPWGARLERSSSQPARRAVEARGILVAGPCDRSLVG
jgi:hypothetical protein